MSSLLLLLLLLMLGSQATHFLGTVMTYYPRQPSSNGSVTVDLRYKLNFHSCGYDDTWSCSGISCGSQSAVELNVVDIESSGEWCQWEGIATQMTSDNSVFELSLDGGNWIDSIKNDIISWRAVTLVDLRMRSDTSRANRPPQTTVLPALRVPSNCARDFQLLAFDPDGDEVRCRYGNTSLWECNPCTPPSVLSLSSTCSLSFSSTNSSDEGSYAVQLVVEDFPSQTITLTQSDGSQAVKTTSDAISKLPVQFVFRVDPAVPSCTEGLYLPRFLPPTPAHRARLYAPVNRSLEISVNAEANVSTVSELLHSGPHNMYQTAVGGGRFVLRWTPSEQEDGRSYAICFVVQAVHNVTKYHSEQRCVIASVGNEPSSNATAATETTSPTPAAADQIVIGLRVRISSSLPLTDEDIRTQVIQQIADEMERRGVPSFFTLTFVRRL